MQAALTKKVTRNSFLLSVILHLALLLFILSISTIINFKTTRIPEKSPQLYIPSYVYKGAITPTPTRRATQNSQNAQTLTQAEKSAPAIQNPQNNARIFSSRQKSIAIRKHTFLPKSILAMSRNIIQQNQVNSAINNLNNSEPPILLIGDRHAIVDPLIKLVGRSLSANFHYPKIEGIFGAKGRVYVELVLHPEGYFSDVQIVQSSNIQDFDAAALYAINTAPTVVGANKFLPQAKRFIVGFIFE